MKSMEKGTEKIRILHFELSENVGGIESFLFNLYSNLNRDKFQFDFVTTSEKPAFGEKLKELGGNIYKVSPYRNLLAYRTDVRKILQRNYDVVHVHKNSASNIIPLIEARRARVSRIIVHSHNTAPSKGKVTTILHQINKKRLYELSDIHLACSDVAGKWMYGDRKFEVVRNGIDTDKFRFDKNRRDVKRRELNVSDKTFVIGNVGRFTEQKNQVRLLDIYSEVKKKNSDSRLLLIGEGDLKESCVVKAKELGIEKNVMFLGNRNDVADLMQAMDAFVMPSLFEGLPIVGVEAQAAGAHVFLADTISKETEITSNVTWFGLEQTDEEIARMILSSGVSTDLERLKANKDVRKAGYDMFSTCKRIEEIYLKNFCKDERYV